MTRFQRLRRADTRGQLDRGTWAALDKIKFETLVRGAGEYLIEEPPIFFGQAFDSPPFFTFSAVAPNAASFPEVKAIGWPNVHAGSGGTKTDELLNTGWLADGSFEHQMVWSDPVIPNVKDHLTYANFQKISADQGPGTGWATPRHENWWVQGMAETSPSQPAWTITNERAFPNTNGYRSRYAASCTFDASGQSRWLIPIYAWRGGFPALTQPYVKYTVGDPYEWHLNDVVSWFSPAQAETFRGDPGPPTPARHYDATNARPLAFNPPLTKFTVSLQVYCTEAMTYEAIFRQWDDLDNSHFGGDSEYRLIQEDTHTQPIPAGQWTPVTFTYPASEYWPNYPVTPGSELANPFINHTWMSRITGGSAGAKAHIDDCYMWPHATTQGGLPMITIGVAEWVQDDGGAYIGAKLWIKVGGSEVIG